MKAEVQLLGLPHVGCHVFVVRVDAEIGIEEQAENRRRAQVQTGPTERGIAIHILGVAGGTGIKQKLNGFFIAEGGSAMKRGLATGADVAHEGPGFN
ncbi:MAG TPA: hypothetical protein VFR24_08340 [Candidatus Angelobacter sp.]|nr:hypothetical protein [Candidatus Angelobacter sp.]